MRVVLLPGQAVLMTHGQHTGSSHLLAALRLANYGSSQPHGQRDPAAAQAMVQEVVTLACSQAHQLTAEGVVALVRSILAVEREQEPGMQMVNRVLDATLLPVLLECAPEVGRLFPVGAAPTFANYCMQCDNCATVPWCWTAFLPVCFE